MQRRGRRWPLALAGALVVAEAAVLLLRPRHGLIEPLPVSARSYFSAAELDRGRAFRRPQLALYGGQLLLQAGLLVFLVRRPPRALARPAGRPLLVGFAGGAALSLGLAVVVLPLAAVGRQRALDVGLATQSWPAWARDVAVSSALGAALAGGGAVLALALARRFGAGWWRPGSAGVLVVGTVLLLAGPIVVDPLFNAFTPLRGEPREDVLALARRAGVRVGSVLEMDASRRTSGVNAYVSGLGPTKRVVLYDTLVRSFSRDERRLVVAHELGHVHFRDVPRGLLYLALVAPLGLLAVRELADRLAPPRARPGSPATLPALALAVGVVALGVTTISNQLSRAVEARADAYGLGLTGAPQALVAFERSIVRRNVSDPDPPAWASFLLGTHPPALARIGAAEAYARRAGGSAAATAPRTPGGS